MSSTAASISYPMQSIARPHHNDVLCGRGNSSNTHVGNTHWRMLVGANKALYLSLPKVHKRMLSLSVVNAIRTQNPPGRFLQRGENGLWFDIGEAKALDKTSQALREGAPSLREGLHIAKKEAFVLPPTVKGVVVSTIPNAPPIATPMGPLTPSRRLAKKRKSRKSSRPSSTSSSSTTSSCTYDTNASAETTKTRPKSAGQKKLRPKFTEKARHKTAERTETMLKDPPTAPVARTKSAEKDRPKTADPTTAMLRHPPTTPAARTKSAPTNTSFTKTSGAASSLKNGTKTPPKRRKSVTKPKAGKTALRLKSSSSRRLSADEGTSPTKALKTANISASTTQSETTNASASSSKSSLSTQAMPPPPQVNQSTPRTFLPSTLPHEVEQRLLYDKDPLETPVQAMHVTPPASTSPTTTVDQRMVAANVTTYAQELEKQHKKLQEQFIKQKQQLEITQWQLKEHQENQTKRELEEHLQDLLNQQQHLEALEAQQQRKREFQRLQHNQQEHILQQSQQQMSGPMATSGEALPMANRHHVLSLQEKLLREKALLELHEQQHLQQQNLQQQLTSPAAAQLLQQERVFPTSQQIVQQERVSPTAQAQLQQAPLTSSPKGQTPLAPRLTEFDDEAVSQLEPRPIRPEMCMSPPRLPPQSKDTNLCQRQVKMPPPQLPTKQDRGSFPVSLPSHIKNQLTQAHAQSQRSLIDDDSDEEEDNRGNSFVAGMNQQRNVGDQWEQIKAALEAQNQTPASAVLPTTVVKRHQSLAARMTTDLNGSVPVPPLLNFALSDMASSNTGSFSIDSNVPSLSRDTSMDMASLSRGNSAVMPSLSRGNSAMMTSLSRGNSAVMPSLSRGNSAMITSLSRGNSAVMPSLSRGNSAMMTSLSRGNSAVLPSLLRNSSAGMPTVPRGNNAGVVFNLDISHVHARDEATAAAGLTSLSFPKDDTGKEGNIASANGMRPSSSDTGMTSLSRGTSGASSHSFILPTMLGRDMSAAFSDMSLSRASVGERSIDSQAFAEIAGQNEPSAIVTTKTTRRRAKSLSSDCSSKESGLIAAVHDIGSVNDQGSKQHASAATQQELFHKKSFDWTNDQTCEGATASASAQDDQFEQTLLNRGKSLTGENFHATATEHDEEFEATLLNRGKSLTTEVFHDRGARYEENNQEQAFCV